MLWERHAYILVSMRNFKLSILLFLFVLIYCLTKNVNAADDKTCTTQDGRAGQCVQLKQCAPLLEMKNSQPYNPTIENYLKKSICGFEDEIYAKVCCPLLSLKQAPLPDIFSVQGKVDFTGPTTSELLPNNSICGPIDTDRIIGGEATHIGDYPWMALLEYDTPEGRKFSCGGSLINNRYVLTAAHCVKKEKLPPQWNLISVRLGEYNITSPEDCFDTEDGRECVIAKDFEIAERIVYEEYNPTSAAQYHDIALLRLAEDVIYSDYVRPICVPTTESLFSKTYTDINMTVAGWGASENNSQSDVLLQVTIKIKPNRDCNAVYRIRFNIGAGQLCAGGEKGKDSCRGDSGGPLMVLEVTNNVNYYIVGVVSFGPTKCGTENWPGIYTKVAPYMPWIVSKLQP